MKDYTNSIIYLGIDVHKLTYSVTALHEGVVIKRDRLPASAAGLVSYCKRFFPNASIKSAYEAGFCGFSLHRKLVENDIDNIVVHPASIEIMANDRIKNDKRDSLKIAGHLAVHRLKGIHIPTLKQEGYRSVSRLRDCFAREVSRTTNRIKGFLYYHGIYSSLPRMSKKLIKTLKGLSLSDDLRFSLNQLIETWEFFKEKVEHCTKKLQMQAENDELESLYRSAPGIGSIVARILSNELGDMSQFTSEKDLFSYCGLTPIERSSGESLRRGHISRQGKTILRKGLTQAAWVAIRYDKSLMDVFERVSQKAGSKRAIQGIARKLIGRIRACIRDKVEYEYKKEKSNNLVKEKSDCQDLVHVSCG